MRQLGWLALSAAVMVAACKHTVVDATDDGSGGAHTTPTSPPVTDPPSCADVGYFECGFGAQCDGNTLVASWHEHRLSADDAETIVNRDCTYDCPEACLSDYSDWPQSGTELIAGMCTSGGGGGGGAGGSGGASPGGSGGFDSRSQP